MIKRGELERNRLCKETMVFCWSKERTPFNSLYFEGIIMIQMSQTPIDQPDSPSSTKTYKVLFTIHERYQVMNIPLDSGTSQKLFVCWDIEEKQVLMGKIVSKSYLADDGGKTSSQRERRKDLFTYGLRNEVTLLEKLSHQNIPKLRGYCDTEQSFCIFMDYCPRGSLQAIVSKQGPLCYQDVMPLWRQLVRMVYFLHCNGIVHRDISPRNVYVNQKGKLQLINFRSAYNIEEYSPLQEGVHEKNAFMAPEVFAGQRVSGKIDVWGMGMTLFYMLYGCSPWPHAKDSDWHRRLGSTIVYPEGYDVPAKLKQCIEKMLVYDPEMRIGAKELARLFGG